MTQTTNTYCDCCQSINGHIARHCDPQALTTPTDDPQKVLDIFRACCDSDNPCDLTLEDVAAYIESL